MTAAHFVFWLSLAALAYTYVVYPLALGFWARRRGRPVRKRPYAGSFTIIVAAHNEQEKIGSRLAELCRLIEQSDLAGDIVVCADGCTDETVACAQAFERDYPVRVLVLDENRGKAAALTEAAEFATGDVLVFADARQSWADDTIPNLLANFSDPEVGAASGDLHLERTPGTLAGIGIYWRLEKWLRKQESRLHAQVGVTGAICAVRRPLFSPIPPGTLLDDVYWPLRVAMAGYRVVHDDSARAFDQLPEKSSAEFRRKVRTLAGNYQLIGLLPESLLPWRNPVWPVWVSHKLMRLVSPWALIGLVVAPLIIGDEAYLKFFRFEAVGYAMAFAGLLPTLGRSRLLGAASSFLLLNAAAWVALWVWVFGRTGSAWRKTEYARPLSANFTAAERVLS